MPGRLVIVWVSVALIAIWVVSEWIGGLGNGSIDQRHAERPRTP